MKKIALGTAQIGLPYGIANRKGQVSLKDAEKILDLARQSEIMYIDTAISYGDSEKVLGSLGVDWAKIVTKLPSLPEKCDDVKGWVRQNIEDSLSRLNVDSLEAILLHKTSDLLTKKGQHLFAALQMLKAERMVKKIGMSIYCPDDLEKTFNDFRPEIIQAPYNVFDRKLDTTGWLERLKQENVEVHTRSVFLQGLLLLKKEEQISNFPEWKTLFSQFESWALSQKISTKETALRFVLNNQKIDQIVVGIDNPTQLEEIITIAAKKPIEVPIELQSEDELLTNPSKWR